MYNTVRLFMVLSSIAIGNLSWVGHCCVMRRPIPKATGSKEKNQENKAKKKGKKERKTLCIKWLELQRNCVVFLSSWPCME